MATRRNIFKYDFRVNRKIVHTGITNDLERRESEHRTDNRGRGSISKVGNKTTRAGALKWEGAQRKKGKPTGP